MTKQIIETIIFSSFFLFGMYTAYWAGNNHGYERGYKRGVATGKAAAKIER